MDKTENTTMPRAAEKVKFLGGDKHIWGIYIALCLISIVELYSASSREVAASSMGVYGPIVRHFAQLIGGLVVVLLVQRIHYSRFLKAIPIFVVASVLMMVYVMFRGESINGATRSFTFIISIQPSEFIKISAVAVIALILSITQNKVDSTMRNRGVIITALLVLAFAGLLIRDGLTNTAILMAISLAMMLVGGIRIPQFIAVILIYASLGGGYFLVQKKLLERDLQIEQMAMEQGITTPIERSSGRQETRDKRFQSFNDSTPKYERAITADNQQEMYSYMAQANGGVLGVFPGNSREASRLPLAFSDFIYSIIIEDLGLVGGIVVLVLFLWLLARASGIASRCHRYFPMLLVIGMAVFIVTQALTHMAIVTGVVPVSGQPLPLISKGGTSILITSLAFGVMLSVSRFAVTGAGARKKEIHAEAETLPTELRGENPSQLN